MNLKYCYLQGAAYSMVKFNFPARHSKLFKLKVFSVLRITGVICQKQQNAKLQCKLCFLTSSLLCRRKRLTNWGTLNETISSNSNLLINNN